MVRLERRSSAGVDDAIEDVSGARRGFAIGSAVLTRRRQRHRAALFELVERDARA